MLPEDDLIQWETAKHYVVEVVEVNCFDYGHQREWYTPYELKVFASATSALVYCRREDVEIPILEETCRKIATAYRADGSEVGVRVFGRFGKELTPSPVPNCSCKVVSTFSVGDSVMVLGNSDLPCSPLLIESEAVVRGLHQRDGRKYAMCTIVDSFTHRIKDVEVPLCAMRETIAVDTPALRMIASIGKPSGAVTTGMKIVANLLVENTLDCGLGFRADLAMAIAGALDSGLEDNAFDVEPPPPNSLRVVK